MKLRLTTTNDLTAVMTIINQAKVYFKEQGINQWQDGYPDELTIINDISRHEAYVLEDNGEIVATAMISKELEPSYNYIEGKWLQDNAYIVVHRIAIRNDQKGKGLAKIIIDEGLKLYPKKPSIRMDTHDDNLSMQRFLIKYGFEYCGTIYLENKETRRAYEKFFNLHYKVQVLLFNKINQYLIKTFSFIIKNPMSTIFKLA
ncbi:MAG: GNAT family N-acetyltransferase [Thomasclavelia ramosa]